MQLPAFRIEKVFAKHEFTSRQPHRFRLVPPVEQAANGRM